MQKVTLLPRILFTTAGLVFALAAHAATNYAPTISSKPATSVLQGNWYSFQPKAYDQNGDTLRFTIANKPSWASFSSSTGKLSGRPGASQVGTYWNIKITVNDGKIWKSLPAFSLTVKPLTTGSMTVMWEPPTTNSDGSTLTNLAGYRIYYGTSSTNLASKIAIAGTNLTAYVIENLPVGSYYVSMTSVNSAGVESSRTPVVKKIIG